MFVKESVFILMFVLINSCGSESSDSSTSSTSSSVGDCVDASYGSGVPDWI